MELNMNRPDREMRTGIDLWEVLEAKAGSYKNNAIGIEVNFGRYSDIRSTMRDNIMMSGDGWPIGKKKLTALGVPSDFSGDFDPGTLVGKRVWIHTNTREYNGRTYLQPDIKELRFAGYQPEAEIPPGHEHPAKATGDGPF